MDQNASSRWETNSMAVEEVVAVEIGEKSGQAT